MDTAGLLLHSSAAPALPPDRVSVTMPVAGLPPASVSVTTGWAPNACPPAPPPGCVEKVREASPPAITVKLALVAWASPPALAVSV